MNYYNKVNMRKVEQNENDVTITVIFIVLNMTFTFVFVTLGTFKPSLEQYYYMLVEYLDQAFLQI